MRIRETVLTYREENGFFIEVKCKEIMFHIYFHTQFLLLAADSQNVIQKEIPTLF